MKGVGIFYEHLDDFTAIWYILWPFGIFHGHLVYFPPFSMLHQEKSHRPGQMSYFHTENHNLGKFWRVFQ
jgi:hypothetical protein